MIRRLAAAAALAVAIAPAAARAEDRVAPPRYRRDVPIVAVTAALYIAGETVAKDALSPDTCRWCDDNALDAGVRDALVWDDGALAATLSDLTVYGVLPLLATGGLQLVAHADGQGNDWLPNSVIVAESALLAGTLTYLTKIAVGRERPFVHQLAPGDKPRTERPSENNLSFFSGHSSAAMSMAVAASTTATLRGYRHANLLWATSVPLALGAGYLRIAADKHWTTDVVTGWVVGAAVGFAVPYFLHRRPTGEAPVAAVSRSSHATTIDVSFTW